MTHPTRNTQKAGRVEGQPALQSESQDSQGHTKKPCLKKTEQNPDTHTHREGGGRKGEGKRENENENI